MNERAARLREVAQGQVTQLVSLISAADESELRRTCPGREKLGDGSIGAVAEHIARNYRRIASIARGHGDSAPDTLDRHVHQPGAEAVSLEQLLDELSAAQGALNELADLTDTQLDIVPPAGSARFCDGQRSVEQVIAAMLNHQRHQVDAVRSALA